jgi:hypothetical protein
MFYNAILRQRMGENKLVCSSLDTFKLKYQYNILKAGNHKMLRCVGSGFT